MTIRSIKNIWFDAAATSAMGEAFERACKTLQDFGSAVPEIVANFIITAAKNGERDAGRLYKQVLADYGIEDTSMPLIGAGGKFLVRGGKTISYEGAAPAPSVVVVLFESLDRLQALYNSARYKDAIAVGDKYATQRIFGAEGVSP